MKLTNYIRDAFIHAAMHDVPTIDYAEEIRKLVIDDVVSSLSPEIKKTWADNKTRPFIKTSYFSYGGVSVAVPTMSSYDAPVLSKKTAEKVELLKEAKRAQEEVHDELRSNLRGAAYGCNTRKALAELLPEFENYLPAEQGKISTSLPVVANLLTDFVKAGWPKDAKKMPKKEAVAA